MEVICGCQLTEFNGMCTYYSNTYINQYSFFNKRLFFNYSLINLKIYPMLGYDQVFWVARDNTTGDIAISLYSEFRADVFCKMELESFPFDKQTCYFEVCTYNLFQDY